MPGFDEMAAFVVDAIAQDRMKREYLARVVEIIGTEVKVRRLGAEYTAIEGPYPTQAGVVGTVKPGDRVLIRVIHGVPIVGWPVEKATRSSLLQKVGDDFELGSTTSVSTYADLQTIDNILIPGNAFALLTVSTRCVSVGGTSAGVRLSVNGITTHEMLVGNSNTVAGSLVFIFPFVTDPARRVVASLAGGTFQGTLIDLEEITSIVLQGRTNNSGTLQAQGMISYS